MTESHFPDVELKAQKLVAADRDLGLTAELALQRLRFECCRLVDREGALHQAGISRPASRHRVAVEVSRREDPTP